MRTSTCEQCGAAGPLGTHLKFFGQTVCPACAGGIAQSRPYGPDDVQRLVDPTVCAKCGHDAGEAELPRVATLPVCLECEAFFRNRPYPAWLRGAFVGLVGLVVAEFAFNWRFLDGFIQQVHAERALQQRDLAAAARSFAIAAQDVPESPELGVMANLFGGIQLLSEDRSAEALEKLRAARQALPPGEIAGLDPLLDRGLLQAELAAAFDRKDYDAFLASALKFEKLDPQQPRVLAQVASAYACQYAVSGDPQARAQAEQYLARARARARAGAGDPEFRDFEQRIRYRIATREILSRAEYHRRFPRGWPETRVAP